MTQVKIVVITGKLSMITSIQTFKHSKIASNFRGCLNFFLDLVPRHEYFQLKSCLRSIEMFWRTRLTGNQ